MYVCKPMVILQKEMGSSIKNVFSLAYSGMNFFECNLLAITLTWLLFKKISSIQRKSTHFAKMETHKLEKS